MSFTGGLYDRDPQDYDNDALVVHMGCFDVPDAPADEAGGKQPSDSEPESPKPSVTAAGRVELVLPGSRARGRSPTKQVRMKLHLFSIAAPGMRRRPENTQDLSRVLSWADPVRVKAGWKQKQKGYFEAPGARHWRCSRHTYSSSTHACRLLVLQMQQHCSYTPHCT